MGFICFRIFAFSGIGSENPREYAHNCTIDRVTHNAIMAAIKFRIPLIMSGVKASESILPVDAISMGPYR